MTARMEGWGKFLQDVTEVMFLSWCHSGVSPVQGGRGCWYLHLSQQVTGLGFCVSLIQPHPYVFTFPHRSP